MNSSFANNLKNLRENAEIKQDFLANKIGISRSLISYYEAGKSEPTLSVLKNIANFFNISIDELTSTNFKIKNIKLLDINSTLDINKFSTDELLNDLIKKKKYYLKEKKKLEKMSNIEIPNKIKEIDTIINYLNSYSANHNAIEVAEEVCPYIEDSNYRDIYHIGKVAAGIPCFAYENIIDIYKIPSNRLDKYKTYFILEIKGDSMNKLYVDGDLLLVEQTSVALDNDLVIVLVNYDEATFKRILIHTNKIELYPESYNNSYKIQSYDPKSVHILGNVIGSLQEYLD